ncbi:acetyl-CoA synthetase [Acetobacter malorum]|uniref:Acetyl-CoA synthetase n=1 Tax=Acetobacter malorum TaxID=178901 RepID=A0A177G9N2_9PROT|nr:acetyl-CoA synthetase [Acetobacter malorum]
MLSWTTYEAMYDAALNQPEQFWLRCGATYHMEAAACDGMQDAGG